MSNVFLPLYESSDIKDYSRIVNISKTSYVPLIAINSYMTFVNIEEDGTISPVDYVVPTLMSDAIDLINRCTIFMYKNAYRTSGYGFLQEGNSILYIEGIKSSDLLDKINETIEELKTIVPELTYDFINKNRNIVSPVFKEIMMEYLMDNLKRFSVPNLRSVFSRINLSNVEEATSEEMEQMFFCYASYKSFTSFEEPNEILREVLEFL